jgi:hypothetical protein
MKTSLGSDVIYEEEVMEADDLNADLELLENLPELL